MATRIDTGDLAMLIHDVKRVVRGSLEKELVKNLHEQGPHIVADMRGAASTKMERAAASTIELRRESKAIEIGSRGGSAFPGVIFDGAEYGGRKSKKVLVTRGHPLFGKAVVVKRRTTMQFQPWLGKEGWFFWPTVRQWMPKLRDQQIEIVEKALGGGR
jgi:hypothetical protein